MDVRSNLQRNPERDLEAVRDMLAVASLEPDALLPLLHDIQRAIGHVPKAAIKLVAQALNLSRADVQGVVSFYHDFHEEPTAEIVVQHCMAEACQSVGCRALADHAQRKLGAKFGERTADGRVQIESAYCFGNCAAGPAIRIGDRIHGRVTNERYDQLIAALPMARSA